MEEYEKNIIPHIEAIYETFTSLEKTIADFFIRKEGHTDLSAKNVSKQLYVSEASLSRFAKKCGYKGYREFLFCYEQSGTPVNRPPASDHIKTVLNSYQELLNKSYSLMDEEQIGRIENILSEKKRIYIYGKGSSGLVGMEMKMRFMRIGVNMEAITDDHIMRMNSVLLDQDCAVIGISVSGKTMEVIESLKAAKRCSLKRRRRPLTAITNWGTRSRRRRSAWRRSPCCGPTSSTTPRPVRSMPPTAGPDTPNSSGQSTRPTSCSIRRPSGPLTN